MQIYLARNNEQAGPYTLEQVNAMLANKQIVLADLAWHEGMTNWLPLGQLTGGKLVYNPHPQKITITPPTSPFKTTVSNKAGTETLANGATLAPVWRRLGAALIDFFLLYLVVNISFISSMSKETFLKLNTTATAQMNALINSSTADSTKMFEILMAIIPTNTKITIVVAVSLIILIQLGLVAFRGQTIGKMLLKIKIVDDVSGEKTTFIRSVLLRSVLVKYIGNILSWPLLFFVDLVFLFTKQNRTLHDRLAKTLVVNAPIVEVEKQKS